MTNVVQGNFRQVKRVAIGCERPTEAAVGNLVFQLEAHDYHVINGTSPSVAPCTESGLWVVSLELSTRNGTHHTAMQFWFDEDLVTHSATAPYGQKITFSDAEKVEGA